MARVVETAQPEADESGALTAAKVVVVPDPTPAVPPEQLARITTAIEQIKLDTGVPLIASVFGYALIAEQAAEARLPFLSHGVLQRLAGGVRAPHRGEI